MVRGLRTVAGIGSVFTPVEKRGRGYAGSVTAALCERIFAEGMSAACRYTDLRNPYSNRCYAKIGFKPYCDSGIILGWSRSRHRWTDRAGVRIPSGPPCYLAGILGLLAGWRRWALPGPIGLGSHSSEKCEGGFGKKPAPRIPMPRRGLLTR